jgi:hypothetical protein
MKFNKQWPLMAGVGGGVNSGSGGGGSSTDTDAPQTTQTLTDAATINWDASLGPFADVTLGGNRTMAAPTNISDGDTLTLRVIQDGTGTRILTWNSVFKFTGGIPPVLTETASGEDWFEFKCDGTNLIAQTPTRVEQLIGSWDHSSNVTSVEIDFSSTYAGTDYRYVRVEADIKSSDRIDMTFKEGGTELTSNYDGEVIYGWDNTSTGNTIDVLLEATPPSTSIYFLPNGNGGAGTEYIRGVALLHNIESGEETTLTSSGFFCANMGNYADNRVLWYNTMYNNSGSGELDGIKLTCNTASGIQGGSIRIWGVE